MPVMARAVGYTAGFWPSAIDSTDPHSIMVLYLTC